MTEAELRHAVGDRVYDALRAAAGCSTTTTPRTPTPGLPRRDSQGERSRSTSGRPSPTCWSTSTSTSSRWTAAGSRRGHRAGVVSLASTPPQRQDDAAQPLVHGPPAASCTRRTGAMGEVLKNAGVKVLPDREPPQQRTFPKPFTSCRSGSGTGLPKDRAAFVRGGRSRSRRRRRA
jgi:hypothetical protein